MNIYLRPWSNNDLDRLIELANNNDIAKYMADVFPFPYTLEHGLKYINLVKDNPNVLAIIYNEEVVGSIGVYPQLDILKKNAEIGYWLGQSYWGKGIMTLAIKQMVSYSFENLDIVKIFARIFEGNMASQKVIEKVGFALEAKFEKTIFKRNQFLNELIYAIRKID